jgi:hypothetical protein
MILTSVPVTSLRMDKLHTIFDPHLSLCVTLSPAKTIHILSIKDFIIGSDKFRVKSQLVTFEPMTGKTTDSCSDDLL